jgi:hypothetical protein
MGLASYKITPQGKGWGVDQHGKVVGDYLTKEAAFEAAVAAASNAIKDGHEVRVLVPGRDAGGKPSLGAR